MTSSFLWFSHKLLPRPSNSTAEPTFVVFLVVQGEEGHHNGEGRSRDASANPAHIADERITHTRRRLKPLSFEVCVELILENLTSTQRC